MCNYPSVGSTDVVACSVHGIRRTVTAALHIIMGIYLGFFLSFIYELLVILQPYSRLYANSIGLEEPRDLMEHKYT